MTSEDDPEETFSVSQGDAKLPYYRAQITSLFK